MSSEFRPELAGIAGRQWGLVTRTQALQAGYDDAEIRVLSSRRGPWLGVRRGVYAVRDVFEALPADERWRRRDLAAHLTMTVPHVLSHDSAAQALSVPLLGRRSGPSHITRPGVGGSRTEFGVKHHLGREWPADLVVAHGVKVTGWARTSLDLAREHGFAAGVAAIDAARRQGASMREFERELALMRRWPHVRRCRSALAFSDPLAESPGESLARILVAELGLGDVQSQFPVLIGSRIVYCDLRVGCHVFEFDGRVKYRPRELGGVADRDPDEVIWEEKRRQIEVCAVGLGMSRLVWADFWGDHRDRAKRRLLAECAVTERRYGRELPEHLARFAALHPRRAA